MISIVNGTHSKVTSNDETSEKQEQDKNERTIMTLLKNSRSNRKIKSISFSFQTKVF